MNILESLKQAQNITPIYEQNGVKVVSFEDQRAAAQAEIVNDVDLGNRTVNPDGTIARSRTKYAAINTDYLYMNRFKKIGEHVVVVTDYRAIKEQSSGKVYKAQIPGFVFSRNKETKELQFDKMILVSDKEFVSDYTKTLNPSAMAALLPLMREEKDLTTDELPI